MNPNKTVAIILAAGEARRMGQAKQLMEYRGKTLIEMAIEKILSLSIPGVVILGAGSDRIRAKIDTHQINISINECWTEGISSSIRTGIRAAAELQPSLGGILLVLADQPGVTKDHLLSLLKEGTAHRMMAASKYGGILGVPAYFPSKYFDQLLQLTGDQGARSLLNGSPESVISITFEPAAVDIDTSKDWQDFIQDDPDVNNSIN